MIASVEELRGGLGGLPAVTLALALAAGSDDTDADREAARVAFGLEPQTEADTPGAEPGKDACSWCGRTGVPLTDQYPRPAPPPPAVDIDTGKPLPVAAPEPAEVPNPGDQHCADETACARTRAERVPEFIDRQFKSWKIDWAKYRAALAWQDQRTGGIYNKDFKPYYALTAPDPDGELPALELAALGEVRDMVERRAAQWLEPEPVVMLAAGMPGPATPAPPPVIRFDPWQGTMRNPAHRTWTLGHRITHGVGVPCTRACLAADAEPEPVAVAPAAPGRRRRRRYHL